MGRQQTVIQSSRGKKIFKERNLSKFLGSHKAKIIKALAHDRIILARGDLKIKLDRNAFRLQMINSESKASDREQKPHHSECSLGSAFFCILSSSPSEIPLPWKQLKLRLQSTRILVPCKTRVRDDLKTISLYSNALSTCHFR